MSSKQLCAFITMLLLICAQCVASVSSPPTVVSVSPALGSVQVNAWKTLTCVYSDPNGATDLTTCNLLINSSVANVGGAHFIYNRVANTFSMKNNASAVFGGVVRGIATTLESENAVLDCAATTVTASGNTLTIAWKFKVKSTMAGKNCNLYMTAADSLGSISGWIDKGDLSINAPPTVVSATPASGTLAVGTWKTITCVYSDPNGATNLAVCDLLINTSVSNVGGAHFVYNRVTNTLSMRNNSGAVIPTGGVVRGTATTIETENAVLDCAATTVTTSGNNLVIAWRFKVKPTMIAKNCNLYMTAADSLGSISGWIDKGDLSINVAPTVISATPASGTLAVGTWKTITCVYSDPNGATDLAICNLLINTSVSNVGGAHFVYNRVTNTLFMKSNSGVMTSGVVKGTATTIETDNASLDCAATTVTVGAKTLTIVWRFKAKSPMAGKNCNLYMTAADASTATSGWIDKGDLTINSLNVAPTVVSITPATGSAPAATWKTFTCVYSDTNGATNLSTCDLIVNTSAINVGGGHFIYNRSTNMFYMKNNANTQIGGILRGTSSIISSENASLDCAATTVTTSGNNLTIAWRVMFKLPMQGKACNLYMAAADASAVTSGWVSKGTFTISTATAASFVEMGKTFINQTVMMEPFDPVIAKTNMGLAKAYFQSAKNLETNNAAANFGLAITDAALTAQGLVDKYQTMFEGDNGSAAASLKYAVGSMQVMNLPNLVKPGQEPLGGLVTNYTDNVVKPWTAQGGGPDAATLIGIQNDVINVVRPMLSRVAGYLGIVETYGGASFTFPIGTSGWENYTIVDLGDVYLFHGGLLAARWALAIPASYSVNCGTFDFNADPDKDNNGLLTTSEWLPPSPFMTLTTTGSATMTGAKADMTTACDKIIAGINATLAETSDNHEMIPWHSTDGPTQADLLLIKEYATKVKSSMSAATTISFGEGDDAQTMRVFLGAWNTTPPADLKALCPTMEIKRWRNDWARQYEYGTDPMENGFPSPTLAGIFPDGGLNESRKITVETGFSGGSLSGLLVYPNNNATNLATRWWQPTISFPNSVPPAVVGIYLERKFPDNTWHGVSIEGWLDDNAYHIDFNGDLWPTTQYRLTITNEGTTQKYTSYFTTGADAPFVW